MSNKVALLITAGGSSLRFGRNKLLEVVCGKPVIIHTILAFKNIELSQIVITVSKELRQELYKLIEQDNLLKKMNILLIDGGNTRQQSVFNGLKAISPDTDFVMIHDGARPLIKKNIIENCLKKAYETNAAIVAVRAIDTIKEVDSEGLIISTLNRDNLRCVQTPQVFDYNLILSAHKQLENMNFSDDSGLLEYLNEKVYVVDGDYSNIKITTPSDINILENYLREE